MSLRPARLARPRDDPKPRAPSSPHSSPRAPGAEFAGVGQDAAEDEAGEKKKPFSALAALRERMERGEES